MLAATAWTTLAAGLDYAEFETDAVFRGRAATITILRIDPASWSLHVGAADRDSDNKVLTARAWCERESYTAAINAGMFQTDYSTHVGYLRDGDHENSSVFHDYESVAAWNPKDHADAAFRIFDLDAPGVTQQDILARYETVVQNLRLIKRPGENRWSRRGRKWSEAALAEDSEGRVLFVYSRAPFTMAGFNDALIGLEIGILCAQHLEGGPEAQLYIQFGDREYVGSYETGFNPNDDNSHAWPIPNVIGIRPRMLETESGERSP